MRIILSIVIAATLCWEHYH